MGRRNARKLAFYLLFQYDFVKDGNFDEIKNCAEHLSGVFQMFQDAFCSL